MKCPVRFWSHAAATADGAELRRVQAVRKAGVLPLTAEGRFYAGRLEVPKAGAVVVSLVSPRPLRLWAGGALVLDEGLFWRSYQREVRAAFVLPAAAGELAFTVEVGPRPRHPEGVDRDCPSRNREKVMRGLLRLHPEVLTVSAVVWAGAVVPGLAFRFLPTQFHREGVTWQHLLVRQVKAGLPPPTTDFWCAAEEPVPPFALSTSVAPAACVEGTQACDRQAGLRRFFAPVATVRDPMPAVRGLGIDARVEPACEVARTLCLTLDGHGGRVSFDMPAFESLGRLAPKREFAATAWPTADQLRAAVPEPVLPENIAHFAKLYYATWDMLLGLTRTPDATSGLPGSYVATGAGFVYHQFVWDSSFTAISTGYGHRVFDPFASLNLLYSRQFDGGYIHREHDVRDGLPALYEPDFSPNPPIMTIAEWAVARLTGNRERLRQVFPVLEGNHAWLRHNRRLPDGTYWTTGLANGLDNFPSLGDGYPCLTAQMAHEAETLARIAQALEMPEKADEYRAEHEAVARAANRFLWSREQGLYATSLPGGGHNPNKVVTTFWPLWAGIVPPERVEALAQHLKDPKSFWRHHPIPSLAADSPHFSPEGSYWRGSTWAPTNFAAIKGFDRAGQHALAVETATRHIQCMLEVFEETGKIWENYCSEASRRGNWSGPNYCWSSLGPVALLLEVILGFEPDALNRRLLWNPPSRQTAGVRRLPLGPATVSVVQQKDWQGKWGIEIDTDRPFTLALHEGECTREIACPVGRSRVTPA